MVFKVYQPCTLHPLVFSGKVWRGLVIIFVWTHLQTAYGNLLLNAAKSGVEGMGSLCTGPPPTEHTFNLMMDLTDMLLHFQWSPTDGNLREEFCVALYWWFHFCFPDGMIPPLLPCSVLEVLITLQRGFGGDMVGGRKALLYKLCFL